MRTCCVCQRRTEDEDLAVLTMTAFATPRYLCHECETDFDKATLSKNPEEITDAIGSIGKKMEEANNDDPLILSTVTEILEGAAERAELIRNGVYDFSNDKAEEEEGDDEVPEELTETEEDRALDEHDEAVFKKVDKIVNIIIFAVIALALAYVIYRIIKMLI